MNFKVSMLIQMKQPSVNSSLHIGYFSPLGESILSTEDSEMQLTSLIKRRDFASSRGRFIGARGEHLRLMSSF